ncbi:MAG: SgcJ/EcaC family oxidoreductase [Pseudomonadota bacterium]
MLPFIRLLVLALCLLPPVLAHAQSPEEAITAAAETWSQRYAAKDLEGLMALYHEEAMLFTQGAPALIGRSAIRDYFAQSFARTRGGKIAFKVESIRVFDDVAHFVSLFKMEIDAGGAAPIVAVGRSMLVYKRDAFGHWLLFADMDNQAPDAQASAFE